MLRCVAVATGPAEPGGQVGQLPPPPPHTHTFLADNFFNVLIIADGIHTHAGARPFHQSVAYNPYVDFCSFVIVQCLTLVSYSDLIVCACFEEGNSKIYLPNYRYSTDWIRIITMKQSICQGSLRGCFNLPHVCRRSIATSGPHMK